MFVKSRANKLSGIRSLEQNARWAKEKTTTFISGHLKACNVSHKNKRINESEPFNWIDVVGSEFFPRFVPRKIVEKLKKTKLFNR